MASEKQIAANRRNAMRSTGPKSKLGKFRSSRNALKHGFSLPLAFDPGQIGLVNSLKKKLLGKNAGKDWDLAAEEFARAEFQIQRIRRTQSLALHKLERVPDGDLAKEVRELAAMDRYERYAVTARERAKRKLEICQNEANFRCINKGL